MVSSTKILLLDEPAAGLNTRETAELKDLLRHISDRGVTIMIVEHDMSLVRSLCDHTVVLNFGRKIYDGPTSEVQNEPTVLEAYLGRPATAADAPAASGATRHAS
jgi:branched-chain amino acid transport system ATP-binding protein